MLNDRKITELDLVEKIEIFVYNIVINLELFLDLYLAQKRFIFYMYLLKL